MYITYTNFIDHLRSINYGVFNTVIVDKVSTVPTVVMLVHLTENYRFSNASTKLRKVYPVRKVVSTLSVGRVGCVNTSGNVLSYIGRKQQLRSVNYILLTTFSITFILGKFVVY